MRRENFYRALRKIILTVVSIFTLTLFAASVRLIKFMFEI